MTKNWLFVDPKSRVQIRGKLSLIFEKKNLNEGRRTEKEDIPMTEWTRREY